MSRSAPPSTDRGGIHIVLWAKRDDLMTAAEAAYSSHRKACGPLRPATMTRVVCPNADDARPSGTDPFTRYVLAVEEDGYGWAGFIPSNLGYGPYQ